MQIFNVRWDPGGIHVGSVWDPCGIRMDFNGILLGIKWDPCGIPGGSKEEVERESQWRGWGREGMKTNDRTDGNTTLEMNNYVAYALPGA